MSEGDLIVCRPTKWFLWRALAMLLMFGFFAGWFYRDWKSGYPGKNRVFYSYAAFEAARKAFEQREAEGQTAEDWGKFVADRTMGEVVEAVARAEAEREGREPQAEVEPPPGVGLGDPWPAVLGDYEVYRRAYEADRDKAAPPLWVQYSNEQLWDSKKPEATYTSSKVRNQLHYAIASGVLAVGAAFFLVRTLRRSLRVDGEAFYAADGTRIPFGTIRRIDKRKWETKGLATIHYEEGGARKKARLDGMVYGQFKPEEGAPAERLFQRILANFSGELVELEEEGGARGADRGAPDAGNAPAE